MAVVTTVGRLLAELHRASPTVRDAVARSAGVSVERLDSCMRGELRLSVSEQLRIADATLLVAPEHRRSAARLRGQALAARSFENGDTVERHVDPPAVRWERAATLRR